MSTAGSSITPPHNATCQLIKLCQLLIDSAAAPGGRQQVTGAGVICMHLSVNSEVMNRPFVHTITIQLEQLLKAFQKHSVEKLW